MSVLDDKKEEVNLRNCHVHESVAEYFWWRAGGERTNFE